MKDKPLILIAILNWGLGHASRMVPLIDYLKMKAYPMIIASNGEALEFLELEFPEQRFIELPFAKIRYKKRNLFIGILLQTPKLVFSLFREHFFVQKIVKRERVSFIISDNRYGVWVRGIDSVLISHQVKIKAPGRLKFVEPLIYFCLKAFYKGFNELWVPDYEGDDNLAGDLSHPARLPLNTKYIGALSRFKPLEYERYNRGYVLFILSGPEPSRSIFENLLIKEAGNQDKNFVLIRGRKGFRKNIPGNIKQYDLVLREKLKDLLLGADFVIGRAGYSSIMDYRILGIRAVLVPTPGQTEQEYLGLHLSKSGQFISIPEEEFTLEKAFSAMDTISVPGVRCLKDVGFEALIDKHLQKQ